MRGHVQDRMVVVFSDGTERTVRPGSMCGWRLVDADGRASGSMDAMTLTAEIVRLDVGSSNAEAGQ